MSAAASRRWLAGVLAVTLAAGACSSSRRDAATTTTVGPVRAPTATVTYCRPGGHPLAMDLYRPRVAGPVPVVLYVHGGGWRDGDRRGGVFFPEVSRGLTARGVAVAAIDYRLAPAAVFPAQIEDTACAVRYLRSHARKLRLDPDRIGAWGESAGGHLVALLGTADRSAGFDVGDWPDASSRVRAVVDLFGYTDLTRLGEAVPDAAEIARTVFATTPDDTATLARYSPVTYVSADDPPFLILQGDADPIVVPAWSVLLDRRLRDAGVPSTLVMVRGGTHGLQDPAQSPSPAALTARIVDFLATRLR